MYLFKKLKPNISPGICLAKHESDLNTKSIVPNRNRSKQYGLFGINSNFYCKEERKGGLCHKNCNGMITNPITMLFIDKDFFPDFIDDDISDDAQCALKILSKDGFKSWPNWKKSCSGILSTNVPNLRLLCNI